MTSRSDRPSCPRRHQRRRDEAGTAIVEFAIVVPLLFTLIFGMFSGGIAYNRKLALANAVREGSRYGATLAVAQAPACGGSSMRCWLAQVASVTEQASESELATSVSAREICVAYVYPEGASTADSTNKLLRTSSGDAFRTDPGASDPPATCFSDGRPANERRVQVTVKRDGKLEYLVSSVGLTLQSRSVTRFEALP